MRCIDCFVAFLAVCIAATTAIAQRSTPVQLLHANGASADAFGATVAVDGDTMIVGASGDDVGANNSQGSAHIYRWTGSGWTLEATVIAADGSANDRFGWSVAISGDTAIIGAYIDDIGAITDQGSAYVFTRSGTTWTQQAKITAADGAASDYFGDSVALSGDTAIVGAFADNVGANSNQGSAYIFTRSGTAWTQQAKITAADGAANDQFGSAVALCVDTAIVGAQLDDVGAITDQGSAYIFTRSGTTWTQQAKITAADGAASDAFGNSVALSGDTAIVGVQYDDVGAITDQGSAYVFTRSGTTWTQQAHFTATDGATGDFFGTSVALCGDTAIVGVQYDDVGAITDQGSAYVFTRSGTTWTQQAHFTATDGATGDFFGHFVAISGDTAIVGAYSDDVGTTISQGSAWVFSRVGSKWIGPDMKFVASDGAEYDGFGVAVSLSGDSAIVGAGNGAYIFNRSGSSWIQQAKLTASDITQGALFGYSVALSGDTAIVGALGDEVGVNTDQGSAYVFTRSGSTWTQQAKLIASDGAPLDQFGTSVALSGDTAIVGAYLDNVGVNNDQGSAYVFTRSGTIWTQQAKLTSSDGAGGDNFGNSVALSGDTAIVGAQLDNVGVNNDQGSAYVFTRSGTIWTQQAKLTSSDGTPGDWFGNSVALSSDTAIVGAVYDDRGSACVFNRSGTTWSQQAKLTASDGLANDLFGTSVAISGETAIVGAMFDHVGAIDSQGSVYIFIRSGTSWYQQAKLIAADGASGDYFGRSVALSGDTAIVGAMFDDVGANFDQGSAYSFDVAFNDFTVASNDVTGALYPSLATAMVSAQSGQQITATQAAWRNIANLDTAGRALILQSSADLRTPSTAVLTLAGSSSLVAPAGSTMAIFGQLRAQSYADVYADSFLLGSRGIMTARANSSLTINAPTANLDGQTRIEQGAALTFAGSVTAIGSTTAAYNSTLTAGGTFTNIDTFSVTSGTINAPIFFNRAACNVFGSTAIFGNFVNNNGAVTTIRSGTLFVFGGLTNNGTIVGTVCSNCAGSPPSFDVIGPLSLGADANLNMPFVDAMVHVGGNFDAATNSSTRYDMAQATLQLEGTGVEQSLEAMSADIGDDVAGLDRLLTGHYPIGKLKIGPAPSTVRLVDAHDNDGRGQSAGEAIYVDTLQIDGGSRLINTSCKIYYNTLINNGTIDAPANLIKLGTSCPADFNADGFLTFEDFDAFVAAFEAGSANGDFNGDGFLTFEDFDAFVGAFEAGC